MTNDGYMVDVRTALLFFRVCCRYKIEDRKTRIQLMQRICAKKKAKYIRDVDKLLDGKKVLKIERKSDAL